MIEKKVALVTGVSYGIGRATATRLLGRGFRTFGTIRETSRAGELLPSLELVRLDVRDEESVRSCVRAVLDQAGRIDALVNNAGYTLVGSLEETSIEEAKALFETNFFGVSLPLISFRLESLMLSRVVVNLPGPCLLYSFPRWLAPDLGFELEPRCKWRTLPSATS